MGVLKANIVLTGGPCAGKTTTIAKVKEDLENRGFHVLLLNECATELINGGIRPFGENAVSVFDFQNEVMNLQLYKEKRYHDIISKLPEETKCVILADRGIMDSKAYLGSELFTELVKYNNLDESTLGNEYDMIIHMVTVATEIENKYNTSTNSARFEDAEEAIDLDKRTSDAWKNHKNLKVIHATDVIDEKIENVIKIIHDYLGIN
ncbi:MAG: ATP-binding protein [Bacilli bacterium]|nr:ATP-binding protein [Bacilli bacterium]